MRPAFFSLSYRRTFFTQSIYCDMARLASDSRAGLCAARLAWVGRSDRIFASRFFLPHILFLDHFSLQTRIERQWCVFLRVHNNAFLPRALLWKSLNASLDFYLKNACASFNYDEALHFAINILPYFVLPLLFIPRSGACVPALPAVPLATCHLWFTSSEKLCVANWTRCFLWNRKSTCSPV